MKMILGAGSIANYESYSRNYTEGEYPYKVPVNSLGDVQLYIDIGASAPGSATYELIHTCGALSGTVESIVPAEYVVGQDTNDNYYGVFRNFSGSTASCFVIAITLGSDIYFSDEYEISCYGLTLIQGCYGNLDPKLSYGCEGVYFGVSQGVTLGDGTVIYKHELLIQGVEVKLTAIKNTFKQGRTRTFRTEKEKLYQFFSKPVPEWYLLAGVDPVFTRGEVFIDSVKWLVSDTPYELVEECNRTWKPTVTLKESCYQSFSCEKNPCASPEEGPCCDPIIISASVVFNEGNEITVAFVECSPAPENGYNLRWRVMGSGDPYTDEGNFSSSPISFFDGSPEGTCYEGYIQSDCGSGVGSGNQIPWATECEESGVSEYSISRTNTCTPGMSNSSFLISGGTPGDIVTVRATFAGLMQKISNNFVRADLFISSPEGTGGTASSDCFTDTTFHGFSITADTIITMTGTTATVNLSAFINNSSETISNVTVAIIDINGDAFNISTDGCRGNSSTGGDC